MSPIVLAIVFGVAGGIVLNLAWLVDLRRRRRAREDKQDDGHWGGMT